MTPGGLAPTRGGRALEWWAFAIVMAWGAYQCFWNLAGANMGADEPVYVQAGWDYLHGDVSSNQEHPPVAKYLMGLTQTLFGHGLLSGRVTAAVAAFAVGLVLYFWLRRELGWVGALAAAGFWLVLPHGMPGSVRLDRMALLEPIAIFFAVAAFAAAWQWMRGRAWWWLALSAAAMALSVTSKVSSAVLVPALLLVVVLRRRLVPVLLGIGLMAVVGLAVAVAVYWPVGLGDSIAYMVRYQSEHDLQGHLTTVAGVAYQFPPWWSNLWFWFDGMGVLPVLVLLAGSIASLWSRRWALLGVMAAAVGGLWLFHLVIADVSLSHYYYAWVWPFCVTAGAGIGALFAVGRRRTTRAVAHGTAAVILTAALVCGVYTSAVVAQERASGMALVLGVLNDRGLGAGSVYVGGMAEWEYTYLLGGRQSTDPDDPAVVAFALKDQVRFPLDPALVARLDEHPETFERLEIDDVTLYLVRADED
ncbi:glycosyltransferase family 39 protein [Herbiconiux moechotypicola]|uniref:Glycosyltransferase RgtA/B/C/D-like domain-containing protein n=1 Tax=Herbiconiux moechotypicola TaxID=637393 RepID=A0ABP5QQ44_9MICO|nr:glycosyltransferase family 39 protein [Herbiconiux moechotypicola]MCS5731021.1 glycosyltransferase family 39 protein [Herbiconiux moechotypicola]